MTGDRILVVEDEPKIAQVLREYLEQAGYAVDCLSAGDQVIPHFQSRPATLILLDLMLPGADGIDVCREIRKTSEVPIIMVTARVEEIDRIIGLELGADDYICKPFSPREVVARVKAVLRRAAPRPEDSPQTLGPLCIDEARRTVTLGGTALQLTPTELNLLKTLMSQPGRVFSRSDLIRRAQGYQFEGYERTVDSHIKNLRKKMAASGSEADWIQSVYGIGYRLVPPDDRD